MNIITKNTDIQIEDDVLSELKYEPSIKSTDIGVSVQHRIVTLQGFVSSYGEKWEAVRVAQRVASVAAVINDIMVNLPESSHRIDETLPEWLLIKSNGFCPPQ